MQSFTLTRDDFAALHRRVLANLRADARKTPGMGFRSMLVKSLLWFATTLVLFTIFKTFDLQSGFFRSLGSGVLGFVAALGAVWIIAVKQAQRMRQALIADNGWFLAPQSVQVSEAGVEQHLSSGRMQWEWSAFLLRQESPGMHFLFIEPGQCLLVPKAVLSLQEEALIVRRVPLRGKFARN